MQLYELIAHNKRSLKPEKVAFAKIDMQIELIQIWVVIMDVRWNILNIRSFEEGNDWSMNDV